MLSKEDGYSTGQRLDCVARASSITKSLNSGMGGLNLEKD